MGTARGRSAIAWQGHLVDVERTVQQAPESKPFLNGNTGSRARSVQAIFALTA
ncbi:MAG: hypothetical protein QOE87_1340 [Gaiellales bacterium]|jgi:hypothetical protein|nr:hypothetical protein [Gaiellales bacterium]